MNRVVMVTTGWVVKKRWKLEGKPKEKTVSHRFSSTSAANTFRDLADRDYRERPIDGEAEVEFYVANDIGVDGLPENL